MDLVPSPIARTLLELRASQADGEVAIGERRLHLRRGGVVDVTPVEGDDSLTAFLVRAGQLSEDAARALEEEEGRSTLGISTQGLSPAAIARATRACWVDRLVLALSEVDDGQAVFTPGPTSQSVGTPEALVPLLLDALSRRAAENEAGIVGSHAGRRLRFCAPDRENALALQEAKQWSGLSTTELDRPLAQVLARHPGAASRIAALLRAGLAQLVANTDSPPAPKRRSPSIIPMAISPRSLQSDTPKTTLPMGIDRAAVIADVGRISLEPPREPVRNLDPGAAPAARNQSTPLPALTAFPEVSGPMDDPLVKAEQRVAKLEQAGAPGPDRADAWKACAQIWQRHYGSLEEAARCFREAAAADPTDFEALRQSTSLCAATGDLDLAQAYAATAVSVASDSSTRAVAYADQAKLARRRGEKTQSLGFLELAVMEAPDDPELLVRLARLASDAGADSNDDERGSPATLSVTAAEALQRAADIWRDGSPERARNLLSWLAKPNVPAYLEHVRSLAIALADDGFAEAAVERLRAAAATLENPEQRLPLWLEAAEIAESAHRPDLAADLLLDAHIAEPAIEAIYEPLITDASESGWLGRKAVWLERFAVVAMSDRGTWLARAAAAFAELPGAREWTHELMIRALCADPALAADPSGPLSALKEHAERSGDVALLGDALERTARAAMAAHHPEVACELLMVLAELAVERLGSAHRSLWAYQRLDELQPGAFRSHMERLREKVQVKDGLVRLAEHGYDGAPDEDRPAQARKLAALLRDQPDHRARAASLYREALSANPSDRTAAASLERLLLLSGRDGETISYLRWRLEHAQSPNEEIQLHQKLSGLHALIQDSAGCAASCIAWLALAPQTVEAIARLEVTARILDDDDIWEAAWKARLLVPTDRSHARAHTARAKRRWARVRDIADATVEVDAALDADPRAADALTFAAKELAAELPIEDALAYLEKSRNVLGDDWELLSTMRRLARDSSPVQFQKLLAAAARLAPYDTGLAIEQLTEAVERGNADSIRSAVNRALTVDDPPLQSIRAAIEKLASLNHRDEAARIALRTIDARGDATLLQTARRLAESAETKIALAERRVAWADEDARINPLRDLASLHRDANNPAGEARALLRLLAEESDDAGILERLASLYAAAGDHQRLLAVLALRLESAQAPSERRRALFDLAATSQQRLNDPERARGFLQQWIQESSEPDRAVREAAGVYLALGSARDAVTFLIQLAEAADESAKSYSLQEQAVDTAEKDAGDRRLALDTARQAIQAGTYTRFAAEFWAARA